MSKANAKFDSKSIQPVELRLLNGQVDLLLRSLELYSYNLEYMLDTESSNDDERQEKLAKIKYTYEQLLSSQAQQVNGKENNQDNLTEYGRTMINDANIINIIPKDMQSNVG